jgi:putative ABC transport system ATP-binding protein
MIVEDNDKLRWLLEDLLRKYGHSVRSFASAEEGLSELECDRFDVLDTDLHLPGIDGLAPIAKAKAVQPSIHVLLMTGDRIREVHERARDAGVDALVEKPMEIDKLVAFLDWVDRRIHEEKKDIEEEPVAITYAGIDKGRTPMPLIVADKIAKAYQVGEVAVQALKDVSFTIDPASFVSFVGPSGSGKTTLLNLIGCLDKPTEGSLSVAGANVVSLGRRQSAAFRGANIGFIFQDFNLIPVLTVYENIEYPLLMVQNIPPGERQRRVTALLRAVGMMEQKDKYPDQISGGQKQRVAVARALVTNPKLVLADEPTANLDHTTAYMVIALMKRLRDELRTTFIFSTHDQKIVGEAEIVYTLEDGELSGRQAKGGNSHG